jgi:uncharacterized protein YerC
MPRVSRSFRNPRIAKNTEPLLWFALSWGKRPREARDLFDNFFTTEERIMFSKRLAALYLIHNGLHYREIADMLAMSTATVNHLRYKYASHKNLFLPLLKELERVEKVVVKKRGKADFIVALLRGYGGKSAQAQLHRALGL